MKGCKRFKKHTSVISQCFCFMLMSRSLVSSRISSKVKQCVSPFWCLVWEWSREKHMSLQTDNTLTVKKLNIFFSTHSIWATFYFVPLIQQSGFKIELCFSIIQQMAPKGADSKKICQVESEFAARDESGSVTGPGSRSAQPQHEEQAVYKPKGRPGSKCYKGDTTDSLGWHNRQVKAFQELWWRWQHFQKIWE